MSKHLLTSYGLTLVVGLPLPKPIVHHVKLIQAVMDRWLPDRFTWYAAAQLHITLAAPLRGRYRAGPPLTTGEMPSDLAGFADGLAATFSDLPPFTLVLGRTHLDKDGVLLIDIRGGSHTRETLCRFMALYPELDPPKQEAGHLHMSLGFLRDPDARIQAVVQRASGGLPASSVRACRVTRVWLVHYANRTLNTVLGRVAFDLGKPNHLTAEALGQSLQIAP